jgi:hypothetical protein
VYFLADLLVPAAPVVVLARGIAVPGFVPHTSRGVVGERRGAGGAGCQDYVVWRMSLCVGVSEQMSATSRRRLIRVFAWTSHTRLRARAKEGRRPTFTVHP